MEMYETKRFIPKGQMRKRFIPKDEETFYFQRADFEGLRKTMCDCAETFFASAPQNFAVEDNWTLFKTTLIYTGYAKLHPSKTFFHEIQAPLDNP